MFKFNDLTANESKLICCFNICILQKLYQQGARTFWIHNTGPIGCLPLSRVYFSGSGPGFYDQNGCVKSHNDVAVEYNRQLKERVVRLRAQLSHAALTYVDVYAAKYDLISNTGMHGNIYVPARTRAISIMAESIINTLLSNLINFDFLNVAGFLEPLKICCGHYEGDQSHHVGCGQKKYVNGSEVFGTSCGNPSMYVSWDGVHYSDAANHWIANRILGGAFSDPPVPINEACYKHP